MSTTNAGEKKRIGFLELPDEALDLFGYYAQRPNWEVSLVVSVDAQSYAARMADVLKIPVLERPNRPALVECDRLIVGKKAGLMAMINELIEDTDIEVIPLETAILALASGHWKEVSQVLPRPDFKELAKEFKKKAPPVKSKGKTRTAPKKKTAAAPKKSRKKPPVPKKPAAPPKPKPDLVEYTSDSTFDAGTLLGADFREKLGGLPIDSNGDQLLHEILKMAVRVTHADSGSIMLVDETGTHLRIAVADGLPQWVIGHTRQEVGKGVSGKVFSSGKPMLVHGHLPASESSSPDVRPGLREAACVPILTKDGPIGVLNISVESEKTNLDKGAIGLLNMFAREASGAILKALNLRKLEGSIHREAVVRQVERLMSLQETLPSRFRSVGEVLGQNLRADYAHCFVVDSDGKNLVLFGTPHGTTALNTRPQTLDRGFLSWVLRNGEPHVLEAADSATSERVSMAYLPVRCGRPYALIVLETVPLKKNSAVNVLNFLTEIQEVIEAYIALEDATRDGDSGETRLAS
jgi:GAF domain-containing protein